MRTLSRHASLVLLAAVLAACSNPENDFRAAEQANTEAAWREFLDQHPDSALAGQARLRLDDLREQQDWDKAQQAQSPEALRAYLQAHPMGPNADAALEQLLDLERRFIWQTATRTATREAFENFLLQYPDAPEAAEARERIATLSPAVPARPAQPRPVQPSSAAASPEAGRSKTTVSQPVAAPKAGTGKARMQFGAFSTHERALAQRKLLASKFGQLLHGSVTIDAPVSGGKDQLYRLRSAPMSEAQARSSCAALKEQGQACVIVP